MTIDSTWLHSFKSESREAFTKNAPFRPSAVFTDGQIRLMQGGQSRERIQTWDEYVRRQFLQPLARFLDTCDTVVLAFDCYDHVPPAKCMTQLKRRRHVPPTDFGEHSCLPPNVPQGEEWARAISNRAFKAKVVELVLVCLPGWLLKEKPGKRLIIDYTVSGMLITCAKKAANTGTKRRTQSRTSGTRRSGTSNARRWTGCPRWARRT